MNFARYKEMLTIRPVRQLLMVGMIALIPHSAAGVAVAGPDGTAVIGGGVDKTGYGVGHSFVESRIFILSYVYRIRAGFHCLGSFQGPSLAWSAGSAACSIGTRWMPSVCPKTCRVCKLSSRRIHTALELLVFVSMTAAKVAPSLGRTHTCCPARRPVQS